MRLCAVSLPGGAMPWREASCGRTLIRGEEHAANMQEDTSLRAALPRSTGGSNHLQEELCMLKSLRASPALLTAALAAVFLTAAAVPAAASGGPSGTQVKFQTQGQIGEVVNNPYDIAPLTSVIKNGGYVLKKAHVKIVPKDDGQVIEYDVGPTSLRTYGGIPIWGLYPEYLNTVEVSYTRVNLGKDEDIAETYRIWTPPVYLNPSWTGPNPVKTFDVEVKKKAPKEFADRLYFINNLLPASPKGVRATWNNPSGGALEWNFYPQNAVVDTTGAVRWYLQPDSIYDPRSIYKAGIMMGFHQNPDGALSWGYGQRYVKYDLMGREIFSRRLPENYADFSHAMAVGPDGHYFLRVSSADLRRADGTRVHTVRDVIIEVDANGNVVDEWRLFDILDPNRNIVLKSIDQGAICLNVDAEQAGKTLTAEQIAKLEAAHAFGDIAGTGAGRNWAHVNSIYYDQADDSIIISSRHQSAAIKIGRDKEVKWILSAPNGWSAKYRDKVLTPVDSKGNPLKCRLGKCEGDFDWTWTQHTAWKIDALSKGDILYLSVFDNGDGRGFEQPENPKDKYSRAVIYKIDQKAQTVEQVWSYGKDRKALYSAITSSVEYQQDKNSLLVYWASIGVLDKNGGSPVLTEFRYGEDTPAVELEFKHVSGYRALPIDLKKAFGK